MSTPARSVALVTLGCTRNDVDSEELAGRLSAEGWTLVDDAAQADVAVVNTCGFIEQAKKDSIDAILEANDLREHGRTQKVVAVGCLAERYGKELADELPEADAVLGFDSYTDMSAHLRAVLDGHAPEAHVPGDRRKLLPISPVEPPTPDCFGSTRHDACFEPVSSAFSVSQSCGYSAWTTRMSPSLPDATISRACRTIG